MHAEHSPLFSSRQGIRIRLRIACLAVPRLTHRRRLIHFPSERMHCMGLERYF